MRSFKCDPRREAFTQKIMADVVAVPTSSGPHLPHLIKWIKHRTSKKENRYASKKDKTSTVGDISSNLLYNKSAIISKSSDNIHKISTDISLQDHLKVVSSCAEFNSLQKSQLKSESMVTLNTHLSTDIGDVICKHGSIQRTCRACMQLPPLPPGHERVLRDLQRQEKKRIRNSTQHSVPLKEQINNEPTPNLLQHAKPAFVRVQTPLHDTSSPEDVYEEIPISFFRGGHVTPPQYGQQVAESQHPPCGDTPRLPHGYHIEHSPNTTEHSPHRHVKKSHRYPHGSTKLPHNESRPGSRQVSLGNLDFEMAKECDGFLVVPLRDKTGNSPVNQANQWQGQCSTAQTINSTSVHCHTNTTTVLPQTQPTSLRISHSASDSGYQDQSIVNNSQPISDQNNSRRRECDDHTGSKGYSHCKRCSRPHGLYHGVSLCHSDVEDLRQELQYLDIAGLDKHQLRGTTEQSSPSLLYNVAHRRSAFSKYVPKRKHSERSSSNSSYSRVPLNAECNGDKDLAILTTDSYKRQSMSAESDYFSSNYTTSQSETSRGSRDYNLSHTDSISHSSRANYVTTSEKSNDTFSEYDITPDAERSAHGQQQTHNTQQEYEYYLAKARHHNMLKNNVKRILRSSESERSDAERSAVGDSALCNEDTISLTSVTSLSELSTMPIDDGTLDRLSCRVHRPVKHHHRSSRHHQKVPNSDTKTPSPVEGLKPQTRTRKPIRKKRKTNKTEYYKLPNFSGANESPKQTRDKNSDTLSVSSHGSGKRDVTRLDLDMPEEHVLSSGSSEKLSCRVTDFRLSDIYRTSSKCTDVRTHNAPVTSCDPDQTRSSVYSNHGQINRNSNNRLLSDLMRMNHDRQLFSLM